MVMETATLVKIVRDPRSGEVHLPKERVAILAVLQNLNRTLLKVRWEAGGDCVIFPDDLDEQRCVIANSPMCDASLHATRLNYGGSSLTHEKTEAVSCFTSIK